MHDWKSEVRARLASLRLKPEREADIVDEIAQHLEGCYRDAISVGASPDEATRAALAEFQAGNALAQRVAALKQGHTPPAVAVGASTGSRAANATKPAAFWSSCKSRSRSRWSSARRS